MSVVDYLNVKFSCKPDFTEILIAELSMLDYDSMMETDSGLEAYIKPEKFNENDIKDLINQYQEVSPISYEIEEVKERNWNEEWEKNYEPIKVDDKVLVRSTFHEVDVSVPYEVIINPRMSFGTGHHATTYLMIKNQLEIDHKGKRVLDAGCGTAILAVMAEKLGAADVIAYDNSSWSTENAPENVELNNCKHIQVLEGTIDTLNLEGTFDIILANINRNVLLDEMPQYIEHLSDRGLIVFSGFYEINEEDLRNAAKSSGLQLETKHTRDGWSSLVFLKN